MSSTSAPTGAMPSDTENQNKPPTGVSASGTSTFVTAAALTGTANHGSTVSTVYVIPTTQPLQNFDYSYQYQRSVDTRAAEREVIPTTCACIGLAFAWIPFIGCMNFLLNLGAPEGSPRALLGLLSCIIASIVFLFFIIYLPIRYAYTNDDW